ncbi:Hypothetical protein R9X50_00516900 [Acrodontium crateriforme]|uniref:Something about silencing protein 4 domain-containing protein n=1 Tax=Acrodontium crateriforme TaxID=150365 RepID=A0AAQ3M5K2_9PEZI|nr:Hypothetical protein R9X50_00516900 [Acrodontium crateriforme]
MMVLQSRSGRPRPSRAPQPHHGREAPAAKSFHASYVSPPAHRGSNPALTDDFDDDDRPSKKRKLDVRHRQTTLDRFAIVQASPLKPPANVAVEIPHDSLVSTANGIRTTLKPTEQDDKARGHANAIQSKAPVAPPKPARSAEKKEEKRTLRSQDDGPRLKSELATYFPNYEEIMFDAPKEPEFLTVDTALYITDDHPKDTKSQQSSPAKGAKGSKSATNLARNGSTNGATVPATPQRNNMTQFNSPSESLEMIMRSLPDHPEDPLTDAHFFKSHRRAERKEKQLRNIERERAMHEKVQLERLLDGLQGHDWLKVLGITGITDGEAKKFESKRDFFIAEVDALVQKFKEWKEEEKKQRMEKDAAAAAAREAESEERDSEVGSVDPPSSDLNASAARQLQLETANAMKTIPKLKLNVSRDNAGVANTPLQPVMFQPPSPEVPITSFYKKRHLREAALGKSRHGRNVTAFGHPIPTLDESEFALPDDYATEDTLKANARERRRRNRASIVDASSV